MCCWGWGVMEQQAQPCPGTAPRQPCIPVGEHPGVTMSSLSAVPILGPLPVTEQIPCFFFPPHLYFVKNSTLPKGLDKSPCEQGWECKEKRIPACGAFSSPISHKPLMPQEIRG